MYASPCRPYWTAHRNGSRYMFLELCTSGDLEFYLKSTRSHLREDDAQYIAFQLFKGLEFLHGKRISHRGMWYRLVDLEIAVNL